MGTGRLGFGRDTRLIYPGPIGNDAGFSRGNVRREANAARRRMGAQMVGGAEARRYRYLSTEAAERESQNENSARCPDQRIGPRRSTWIAGRSGPRMLGDVQCLPMSLHRVGPLIGNFDSRACRISI